MMSSVDYSANRAGASRDLIVHVGPMIAYWDTPGGSMVHGPSTMLALDLASMPVRFWGTLMVGGMLARTRAGWTIPGAGGSASGRCGWANKHTRRREMGCKGEAAGMKSKENNNGFILLSSNKHPRNRKCYGQAGRGSKQNTWETSLTLAPSRRPFWRTRFSWFRKAPCDSANDLLAKDGHTHSRHLS